ncbi:MAG TPA: type II toxin-antitoxin system PemK/MazF family toxin [Alphaproteobacteria bacterium]|nr:type II toxin-antitoxin system PemK/MazF family toxin [Alphaproteobacteria bacterium]
MRRGDVVLAATPGDYGKPRPAVVTQSDIFNETHPSVVMCPLTTFRVEAPLFRITVEPTEGNGLRQSSQVMVDKITTLRRDRLRSTIGRLDQETMRRVDRALAVFLGLG